MKRIKSGSICSRLLTIEGLIFLDFFNVGDRNLCDIIFR